MSRAFRARPLDFARKMDIVRDLSLLDSSEGLPAREVVHNHASLDAENEKVAHQSRAVRLGRRCFVPRRLPFLRVCSRQPSFLPTAA